VGALDGAETAWREVGAGLLPRGFLAALAVDPRDAGRLYVGYAGFGLEHVHRSTDGGATWAPASGSPGAGALPDIPVAALLVDGEHGDMVYAATDVGVFRSTDGGATWDEDSAGLPRVLVSGLAACRRTGALYASTMGRGVYRRGP
jgi:photosystem II stability/assembly factor-like uncharacterized protein